MDVLNIVAIVVSGLLGIGFFWVKAEKANKVIKEIAELLVTLSTAIEDKKLTKAEIQEIIDEAKDIAAAFK